MQQLESEFSGQTFANGYELVDGVAMQAAHGEQFVIPPDVLKRHIRPTYFVEVRVDSPRFSMHDADAAACTCSSCGGAASKPVLSHTQPASLLSVPDQVVPSRGWGEDFWVQVVECSGDWLAGRVDNPLVETRLHGIRQDDRLVLANSHVLTIHSHHRQEMVCRMDADDLQELTVWLGSLPD